MTELLIALALGLFTIAAVYGVHLNQVKRQIVQEDVLAMQQTARAALDMMAREIRMAGYDPMGVNRDAVSSNDFYGLGYHPTELHVRADLNGNGVLTDSKESIVYLYDDSTSTLRRKVGMGVDNPWRSISRPLPFRIVTPWGIPRRTRRVFGRLTCRSRPGPPTPTANIPRTKAIGPLPFDPALSRETCREASRTGWVLCLDASTALY